MQDDGENECGIRLCFNCFQAIVNRLCSLPGQNLAGYALLPQQQHEGHSIDQAFGDTLLEIEET
jgi:hypothetical protein